MKTVLSTKKGKVDPNVYRGIVKKCYGAAEPNWALGIRSAKILFKRYPYRDFWIFFSPFPTSYPVHVYLGGKGSEHVQKQWELFSIEKESRQKYNTETEISRKPLTFQEFMKEKYGQKN